jgi:prepilin-type N-terminal cleavage/methylation domain-containing protein
MRTPGHQWRSSRESGFTLIEVLVSLVILGLILAYLPSSVRFVRGTWEATQRLDRQAGQEGGKDFILARLSEALPLYEPSGGRVPRLLFSGGPQTLSFVAPSQNGPVGAGLYHFELRQRPSGAGVALVALLRPYGVRPDETPAEEHVLVEDTASISFRYLGRMERLGAARWSESWTRPDALPDAVELTVTSNRRGAPPVRTLLVELRLRSQS